jgi:hypothetical protein
MSGDKHTQAIDEDREHAPYTGITGHGEHSQAEATVWNAAEERKLLWKLDVT